MRELTIRQPQALGNGSRFLFGRSPPLLLQRNLKVALRGYQFHSLFLLLDKLK